MEKPEGKRERIVKALQNRYVEGEPRYTEDQCVDRLEFARDQCIAYIVKKYEHEFIDSKEVSMSQDILTRTLTNLTMLKRKDVKDGFASGMKISISFEDDEEEIVEAENHVADAITNGTIDFEESADG